MADKPNTISQFLSNHLWQIIILAIGGIVGFTFLKAEVIGIQHRVSAMEKKQASYPSQDWFELKFEIMDERFASLEKKIDGELK